MYKFNYQLVQGAIELPRLVGPEKNTDLHLFEESSKFEKKFMALYCKKGVMGISITPFGKDEVQMSLTLSAYYPEADKFTRYWFHEGNLELSLINFCREYTTH